MGGTSTDVSRYAGTYEHIFESTTAGVTIQSPQLDINTVAAGGGSRLFYRNGLFVVGPESAGAHPGPACYRKQGPLAVTDANVLLGRIQPHLFPKIFGPTENEPLDLDASKALFDQLTSEINSSSPAGTVYTTDEVAFGFIRIANEAMARPIRNLTTMKGYDVTKHLLACFGGAGPQHCCAIAKSLGMKKVFVHKYSGILSAYGLSLADVVVERQEPFNSGNIRDTIELAIERMEILERDACAELQAQGFPITHIKCSRFLNCRYSGTDTSTMTCIDSSSGDDDDACSSGQSAYERKFIENYRREYGFELIGRAIVVDDVRVRAVGVSNVVVHDVDAASQNSSLTTRTSDATEHVSVYFEGGRRHTPVYHLKCLALGTVIPGPAIIMQDVATVVVEPDCTALITMQGNIEITIEESENKNVSTALDPIYLSIFSHRFMGIAEQMGRTLQRTSISVNIKERLDFSCALFDSLGGLVANAPHLPVHLGAMSEAVRYQVLFIMPCDTDKFNVVEAH